MNSNKTQGTNEESGSMTQIHAAAHDRNVGRQWLGQPVQCLGLRESSEVGENLLPIVGRDRLNLVCDGRAP